MTSAITDPSQDRSYETPDGLFPSITTILKATMPARKRRGLAWWYRQQGQRKAEAIRQQFQDWGHTVHAELEARLSGAPSTIEPWTDPEVGQAADAAMAALEGRIGAIWAQEQVVWSASMGVAGRLDVVGEIDGAPCVLDFKVVRKPKDRPQMEDYFVQGAFYALAWNEMHGSGIDRVAVVVAPVGGDAACHVEGVAAWRPKLEARLREYRGAADPAPF